MENKEFFNQRPWYITEKVDKIQYVKIKSRYFSHAGEIAEAYRDLTSIPEEWLYEEEKSSLAKMKAMLLWQMGDFSAAVKMMESQNLGKTPLGYMLQSFVSEYSGDFDAAYQFIKNSKDCLDIQELDEGNRVQILYNYGRLELIRGNRSEALYYMQVVCDMVSALKPRRVDLIHRFYSQYIFTLALDSNEKAKAEEYLEKYHNLIKDEAINNMIQFNNCKVSYYRQFHESTAVYQCIVDGYRSVMSKLKNRDQRALYQVSTFRMLMNGYFVHDWLDKDIEKEYRDYKELPELVKLTLAKEFMGILSQPDFFVVKNKNPYNAIYNFASKYYRNGSALKDIDACIAKLDPHEIAKKCRLMQDRLGILKYMERENHIAKSKSQYFDLYNIWLNAGSRIDATNTLMILVDECMSPFNLIVQLDPGVEPMIHQDFLDSLNRFPEPILMDNGVQLQYIKYNPPLISITHTNDNVMIETLEIVMKEVEKWHHHPAKYEFSIHLAHYLVVLGRFEEAKKFYDIFKESRISVDHYAAWVKEEIEMLDARFGNKKEEKTRTKNNEIIK